MATTEGPSRELAEFAVNMRCEDLPPAVVQKQKDHLLDGLGNGLYGSTTELGRQVLALLEAFPSGSQEATVWGSGKKVNCLQAAFANATFANIAELEDAHHRTKFKPNTCLLQAGVAVAERQGSGGRDLLAALVAGTEVGLRVATATHVGKEGYARGWIGTSSIGPLGAAVVAGRLIGLDVEQMMHAIALGGNQPSGLWSTGLTMGKRVAIGRAAENGVFAAFMAARGITGGDGIFDGNWGNIGHIISPVYEPELLTVGLGQQWRTLEVGLECYPTKGGAHSSVDALLDILQREPDLQPEEIERMVVRTTTGVAHNKALYTFPPHDFWESQNSLPYILAVTAYDRVCGLEQFTEERVKDERVLALGARVRMEVSEEANRMPPEAKTAFLDVYLRDGRMLTSRVDYCSGEPQNPLSPERLQAKFRNVAKYVLNEAEQTAVIDTVMGLDQVDDTRELARLLARA